jgi:gentisate 1,2-dioxygenase
MQSAKTDMIEQMRKGARASADKAAPSVMNKLEPGTTGNVHQEVQAKIEVQEGVGEEEETEEEEYIEDDDQVVVPWGQAIDSVQGTLAKEEEEGTYSEDELGASKPGAVP